MERRLLFVAALLPLFILSNMAWATNGLFPTSAGVQQQGRGGVDFGIASSPTAMHTNPAGIAFIPGKMVDFTFGGFYPRVEFSNAWNDDVRADDEVIPFAAFGFVCDEPGQIAETATDPFVYTFGGRPNPGHDTNSDGEGIFDLSPGALPQSLELIANGEHATLSAIRVYALIAADSAEQHLWADRLPTLPAFAQVRALRVRFDWRQQAGNNGDIILRAEQLENRLPLVSAQAGWQQGYLVIVWKDDFLPVDLALTTTAAVELRDVEVAVNFRLGTDDVWLTVHRADSLQPGGKANRWVALAQGDTPAYQVRQEPQKPLVVSSWPSLPAGQVQKVAVYYHYRLDTTVPDAHLQVTVNTPQGTSDSRLHVLPAAERNRHGIVWNRSEADWTRAYRAQDSGWKFGIGVFPLAGARYTLETKSDLFPEGVENRTDLMSVAVAPTIAYRVNDRFSIGVSLNANVQRLEFDGLVAQRAEIMRGVTPLVVTFGELFKSYGGDYVRGEVDSDPLWAYGVGGRVGIMWKLTDFFQLGLMYSPKAWMSKSSGKAKVDFTRHFDATPFSGVIQQIGWLPNRGRYGFATNYDIEIEMELPQRAGAGVAFLLRHNLTLGVDFQWINYADTQFKLKTILQDGDNPDANTLIGSSDLDTYLTLGWKDQYVVSAGIVWQPSPYWILRAGYNYSSNPVPRSYLNPQFAAIIEHHVSAGVSLLLDEHVAIHVAGEGGLPARLKSGSVNHAHPDFANSELEIYTIGVLLGISWRF